MSPVDKVDTGAQFSSEERAQSALDHLTAEERNFAYTGGVENEYGHWQPGENPFSDGQEYETYETFETENYAGSSNHDIPGEHPDPGRTVGVPDGNWSGASRRRAAGTSRIRAGARAAGSTTAAATTAAAAASRGPSRTSERGASQVLGRSSPGVSVRSPARRRSGSAAAAAASRSASSSGARSMGRSGQRLRVRVAVPRASATTPEDPGARIGRPPSYPGSSFKRRASLASSTTPSRTKPGGGGVSRAVPRKVRGSGAGVLPLPRRGQPQTSPLLPASASRRQPEALSGGGGKRRALVDRESGGSGGGGYLDTDLSLGSATPQPRRARGTTPGGGSVGAGAGGLGTSSRIAGLGRSGAAEAARRDESRSAAIRRPPKPTTSSRQAPGGARIGAREHVSLMRRRRERGGLGSSFASSRTVGGGGGGRRPARGAGGGLGAGAVNSSTCSGGSRAWKP